MKSMGHNFRAKNIDSIIMVEITESHFMEEHPIDVLGQELSSLTNNPEKTNVILDLSSLKFMATMVMSKFIVLQKRLRARGGKLILCNLQPYILETIRLTQLHKVFEITKNRKAAFRVILQAA